MFANLDNGYVVSIGDGIAKISGLTNIMSGEMVCFPKNGIKGLVLGLSSGVISVVVLGNDRLVSQEDKVERCNSVARIPLSFSLLGSVVDSLCNRVDGEELGGSNKFEEKNISDVT